MRFLFTSERERLLQNILSNTNSDIESVTLESFQDMSEDDLRNIMIIGNGRIRHAYRPETLYNQYLNRRGRDVSDPLDPSYILNQNELNTVFNYMRRNHHIDIPTFNEEQPRPHTFKQLIDDYNDNINNNNENEREERRTPLNNLFSDEPHPLLRGRNTYIEELERDFENMINRREPTHHTRERRRYPQEFDSGKGPGGFPLRNGGHSDFPMPAKEPLFENHNILLYDPNHNYTPTKQQIHTFAYTYTFSPYRNMNIEVFSPGNYMNILSESMPLWMTEPKREKREKYALQSEMKERKEEKPIKVEEVEENSNHYLPTVNNNQRENKFEIKWLILAIVLIFLLKTFVKKY